MYKQCYSAGLLDIKCKTSLLNVNGWCLWRFKNYSWVWNVHPSVFIMNYSLFPHSPHLSVHHTCKCIMHFSLFILTQNLWSPVNNQPGKGFAVLTHCIHSSFVAVYCAHCPRSGELKCGIFQSLLMKHQIQRCPNWSKNPKPSPSMWIVTISE